MDYFKNIDYLQPSSSDKLGVKGIQYSIVQDLATEPVDLEFFKEHARIDFNTDDALCEKYIKAARQFLEGYSQLSFGVKTMRLMALELPDNYKLMFGSVDTITTPNYSNFGDILTKGGSNIDIEYTTKGIINDDIRIAICRYAAGLYVFRENIIETKYVAQVGMDEAKEMLKPYMNITMF